MKTTRPLRHYLMALFDRRRTPIRVPKSQWPQARAVAREWWEVTAPNAIDARALCLAWPTKAVDGNARITNHGKART